MEADETIVQTEEGAEEASEQTKPEPTPKVDETLKKLESLSKEVSVFQSQKDKAVAESIALKQQLAEERRRRETVESALEGLRTDYQDEPEHLSRITQKTKDAKLQAFEAMEKAKAEEARKQQEVKTFFEDLSDDLEDYGLDINDQRLKNAASMVPVGDFRGLRRAIIKEAKRISKEGEAKVEKKDDKYESLMTEIENLKKQLAGEASQAIPPVSGAKSSKGFTPETVRGMSASDLLKNAKEIAKLPLNI